LARKTKEGATSIVNFGWQFKCQNAKFYQQKKGAFLAGIL
jgi:hypothetical protein